MALGLRHQGSTPILVLLTDGRGNIALDGTPNRALAAEQLVGMASRCRSEAIRSICIDIARRPREAVAGLAQAMGADLHFLRHARCASAVGCRQHLPRGGTPVIADRTWLDWETDGRAWPHREASQFHSTCGYRWHVQTFGQRQAPVLVLLHGTGAASFSWRTLVPLLQERFHVVVPDLPCHGFTRPLGDADLSLEGMTAALHGLLRHLKVRPDFVLGHSAGAVIALALTAAIRHASDGRGGQVQMVFGVNGALEPIRGKRLLSPIAKALFATPLSASMFSLLAKATPLWKQPARGDRIQNRSRWPSPLSPSARIIRSCPRGTRHDGPPGT